jgi:hypothetical protein
VVIPGVLIIATDSMKICQRLARVKMKSKLSMPKRDSKRIELSSPLTPAGCASRLREVIDIEGVATALFGLGSKPVIGKISESSFRLRRRIRYGNSFQIFLFATIRPKAGGTLISIGFAMHPFVRIFSVVWFAALTLIGGKIFLSTAWTTLFDRSGDSRDALGIAVPLAMLGFGIALLRFGRYLARNDPRFLSDFLIEKLDAHP